MAATNRDIDIWETEMGRIRGRFRHLWTENEDSMVVDLLGELVARGAPKGFESRRHNWCFIASNMRQRLGDGVNITEIEVGQRLRYLKHKWCVVADMLGGNGFTWDPEAHKLVAEEHVWVAYIAGHSYAAKFRDRPFPLFARLDEMFRHQGQNAE